MTGIRMIRWRMDIIGFGCALRARSKEIKMNSDPSNVADIFRRGSGKLGFHLEVRRTS
jgi:hypothetical protein